MAALGLLVALLTAPVYVTSINGGNALTLPAQRHMVRLDPQDGRPATWLLAVQQDGATGHYLGFFRSTDEGQSWHYYAPIQDGSHRDTPDLVVAGMDVALVYSYEGPTFSGSTAHDVYFQWWRWNGNADWFPQAAVRVFDSASSTTGYGRAELARDSKGRFWVWAQRLNSDGTFTMVMSVSGDGGSTFQTQPSLDSFPNRPGGRILPVGGGRMMLLYSTHGVAPGYMRLRSDSDPVSTWGARQLVFSEGIYHGAALSAASDGSGGVHLAYKDSGEVLWYRHWDGSAWSGRQLIEGASDWALQPAITRVGGALVIFWNRVVAVNTDYRFYYRILQGGTLGPAQQVDGTSGFKGYPAAVEALPTSVPEVPCFYGHTPDASTGGQLALVFAPTPNATAPPPPPPPPPPGSGGGTPFFDDFNRTLASGLGPDWQVRAGRWRDDGQHANSDATATDQAAVIGLSCGDCTLQARVVNFAATTAALDLREQASGDRYDLALTAAGRLQIRRWVSGSVTVLGEVASGIADLTNWSTLALSVSGAGPVQLVGSVNGVAKLSVTDSTVSAITGPGTAGMTTSVAGVWFDDFTVTGTASSGGGGGGGTPDAGTPDAGTADGGTPAGTLFFDDFNRTLANGLGPAWRVDSGAWRDNDKANSDANGTDRASVLGLSCADCTVQSRLVQFETFAALSLRQQASGDRYDVALTSTGRLQVRRHRSGTITVLGEVASGIADLTWWATISLRATGTAPVQLVASVNGVARLTVADGSGSAITAAGTAGIETSIAGVWFDDFTVTAGP